MSLHSQTPTAAECEKCILGQPCQRSGDAMFVQGRLQGMVLYASESMLSRVMRKRVGSLIWLLHMLTVQLLLSAAQERHVSYDLSHTRHRLAQTQNGCETPTSTLHLLPKCRTSCGNKPHWQKDAYAATTLDRSCIPCTKHSPSDCKQTKNPFLYHITTRCAGLGQGTEASVSLAAGSVALTPRQASVAFTPWISVEFIPDARLELNPGPPTAFSSLAATATRTFN